MTKQEVFDVIWEELKVSFEGETQRAETQRIVDALWSKFILLHQGEKADLPEGVHQVDSAPERSCVRCGNSGALGYIDFAGGATMCVQCLEDKSEDSREAREFWERVLVAYLHAPKNFPNPKGGMLMGDEVADLSLAHWLKRFGVRKP